MGDSFVAASIIRCDDAAALSCIASQLTSVVHVVKKPDRGRCLESNAAVEAGAVVLAESPVCWWVDPECQDYVCAHCLETFAKDSAAAPRCEVCGQVRWCSTACQSSDSRHGAVRNLLVAAGSLGGAPEDLEAKSLLFFVAHATALRRTDPAAFAQLWSLMLGTRVPLSAADEAACNTVASLLQRASPSDAHLFHISIVRELCLKDKTANFAVMLPPPDVSDGEMAVRRVRGYATYPRLSLANHSCLPTVARFDHFDGRGIGGAAPTDIKALRAAAPEAARIGGLVGVPDAELGIPPHKLAVRLVTMHALPARTELLITYMPPMDEPMMRKERLLDEYGFECRCHRCTVEFAAEHEGDEHKNAALKAAEAAGVDSAYIMLFLLKHVCPVCQGTLAPLLQVTMGKCNRCGATQTEEEFMERVEAYFEEDE